MHDNPFESPKPVTIRLSDPAELVAGLAALFGFWPRHSLMFVAVDDRRGILGFRARADLPELCDVEQAVSQLVKAARANDVSAVIVLAHSNDTSLRMLALEQLADAFARGPSGSQTRCTSTTLGSGHCGAPTCGVARHRGAPTTRRRAGWWWSR
jgi:hypothetical protein